MTAVIPSLIIGGQQIPTNKFDITGGAYGSTGSLQSTTSLTAMAAAGVDLVALSTAQPGSLPVDIYVTMQDGSIVHPFSGEYLTGAFSYKADLVTVHARDWSGPLVDQKRALTALVKGASGELAPEQANTGISTSNQKLSALVTQIAQQFDLNPVVNLNGNISNSDADYGAIFGDTTDTILTSTAQSLWSILTKLARQTGNIVYVTPEKDLKFGEAGAGLDTLQFTWKLQNPPPFLPLMDLDFTHNPRRNLTFKVLVKSYDPTLQQLTSGQAFVIGSNYSPDGSTTVSAGAWGGAQASQISSAIGSSKKNAIPVYVYHVDGLTASQAQSRAESIANDISKRELIASLAADFLPNVEPGQKFNVSGQINPGFSSHTYFVTSFGHHFMMSRDGSGELATSIKGLDRQPEGQGTPTSVKANTKASTLPVAG